MEHHTHKIDQHSEIITNQANTIEQIEESTVTEIKTIKLAIAKSEEIISQQVREALHSQSQDINGKFNVIIELMQRPQSQIEPQQPNHTTKDSSTDSDKRPRLHSPKKAQIMTQESHGVIFVFIIFIICS